MTWSCGPAPPPVGRRRVRARASFIDVEALDIDGILDRHRDRFRALVREIVEEERGDNPFTMSLHAYLQRPAAERAGIVERAGVLARGRAERELARRHAAWIVMVGEDVVLSSNDRAELPTVDEVLALGRGVDRVPFLFEAALIEELSSTAAWSRVESGIRDDLYPTLAIELAGATLVADLDTGSHGTFIDDELEVLADAGESAHWFVGIHLGTQFSWSPDRVRARVRLADGTDRVALLPVRRVRGWGVSPFVRLNPLRRALVGRDLLRALGLALELRAVAGATTRAAR